uniref:SPC3 n=1 Tax=Meloidogyne javanica TaxID=6303 RepID=A0A915LFU1_MELJA
MGKKKECRILKSFGNNDCKNINYLNNSDSSSKRIFVSSEFPCSLNGQSISLDKNKTTTDILFNRLSLSNSYKFSSQNDQKFNDLFTNLYRRGLTEFLGLVVSELCLLPASEDNILREESVNSQQQTFVPKRVYTNQWAVRIAGGHQEQADELASKYGFRNLGPVIPGGEFFLFESRTLGKRSLRKVRRHLHSSIRREENVVWLEQQVVKKRVKRDFLAPLSPHQLNQNIHSPSLLRGRRPPGISSVNIPILKPIIADGSVIQHADYVENNGGNGEIEEDYFMAGDDFLDMNRVQDRAYYARMKFSVPNDPFWKDMWYLHRRDDQPDEMDHNVKEAWALGYTGRGVVITILDDGLERTHHDLAANYDPDASYDVNDRDEDPMPRYDYADENRHGTRCAGEVAAVFNNSLCVVGIAFNAKIGGIRMLDGDVTDAVEATSLSHNSQHIDIYSASWGPDDDGRTVDGPATLTKNAFERGITEGRQGKGSIFIWASGNGGKAYSSGASGERMIVTTDLRDSCTKTHTGTSASAPLAAGIAALTLEANQNLGWRDLQHIVVRTAKPVNLRAGDWRLNGIGRNVSHSFGYGLLDAGAMVRLAKVWRNVPKSKKCRAIYPNPYKTIPRGNRLHLQLYTDVCADKRDNHVKYLEHVQAIVTLSAPKRGDIQIYLTSPRGTRSTLLAKRQRDTSRTGFKDWAFMTTHNWGESAYGTWSLEIDNDGLDDAELLKWELVLYGTDVFIGPTGFEPSSALSERSVQTSHNGDSFTDSGVEQRSIRWILVLFASLLPLLIGLLVLF